MSSIEIKSKELKTSKLLKDLKELVDLNNIKDIKTTILSIHDIEKYAIARKELSINQYNIINNEYININERINDIIKEEEILSSHIDKFTKLYNELIKTNIKNKQECDDEKNKENNARNIISMKFKADIEVIRYFYLFHIFI